MPPPVGYNPGYIPVGVEDVIAEQGRVMFSNPSFQICERVRKECLSSEQTLCFCILTWSRERDIIGKDDGFVRIEGHRRSIHHHRLPHVNPSTHTATEHPTGRYTETLTQLTRTPEPSSGNEV